MSEAAIGRLLAGYYNSDPVSGGNPGGLAAGGHVQNFPAALADVGAVGALVAGAEPAAASAASSAAQAESARIAAEASAAGSLHPGQRNLITNGGLWIWQRGVSFTSPGFGPDRVLFAGVNSIERMTDVPDASVPCSVEFGHSPAALSTLSVNVESALARPLAGGPVRATFWARSIVGTGRLFAYISTAAGLDNFSTVNFRHSLVVATAPSAAWTKYSASIAALHADAVNGLRISIRRDDGANGGTVSTTRVAKLQLEAGAVETPFETLCRRGGLPAETRRCRHYFQRRAVWVPAEKANLGFIDMRAAPTISGGGAGASFADTTADTLIGYQTAAGLQVLDLSAEL
ncbi:MAG: hypothetical protein KIS81_00595 [Maricaulaceae bacterium]|nr:hypothetical protein [Maricaulaceae bacterium]